MGKKEAKTNAIRILETMKIPYEARTYECDDFVDAAQIADKLGLDHAGMYKTITTVGKSGGYYVFVVPIDDEIDFKKAVSGGRLGLQITLSPDDLCRAAKAEYADIIK